MPYAELLRDLLARNGLAADVANHSTWMGTARDAVRDWPVAVWAAWPDLVVIHHGVNEARSLILPPFLHRTAWTFDRSDRRAERHLINRLRGAWPRLGRMASRWDHARIPGHLAPTRFGQQMARVVAQTTAHTQAVCVVIGLNPVNDILLRLGGEYPTRRARLMEQLENVVSSRPRVEMVRLEEIEAEVGDSRRTFPDGIHLSPLAHRLVAHRIAELYHRMATV